MKLSLLLGLWALGGLLLGLGIAVALVWLIYLAIREAIGRGLGW